MFGLIGFQPFVEALHIAAGHEMFARAFQQHATHRSVAFELAGGFDHALGHLFAERIQRLGSVEGDDADAVLDLRDNVSHGNLRSLFHCADTKTAPAGAVSRYRNP
jgi:hypothetical protein